MNADEATIAAREFLRALLDVKLCSEIPRGLYAFDPGKEFLFAIVRSEDFQIGSTRYLAVSKTTGEARYAGSIGE